MTPVLDTEPNTDSDDEQEDVVLTWIENIKQMAFIYDLSIENLQESISRISVVSFVLDAIGGTLNVLKSVLIPMKVDTNIILGITLAGLGLNCVSMVVGQMPRLKGWTEKIKNQQKFLTAAETFVSEATVKHDLGKCDVPFLDEYSTKYLGLIRSPPELDRGYYLRSLKMYKSRNL